MQRQVVLYSQAKTLRWVIGEAGLRWRVGPPEVVAAQLDRLAALTVELHLDVRVLPFERGLASMRRATRTGRVSIEPR
jgi:hypothetical protein